MDREDAETITEFETSLATVPEVRHAERLFGDPDYLVRVATADIAAYQRLRDEELATLPGVRRLTSTIVMKLIVDERPFPPAGSGWSGDRVDLGPFKPSGRSCLERHLRPPARAPWPPRPAVSHPVDAVPAR